MDKGFKTVLDFLDSSVEVCGSTLIFFALLSDVILVEALICLSELIDFLTLFFATTTVLPASKELDWEIDGLAPSFKLNVFFFLVSFASDIF